MSISKRRKATADIDEPFWRHKSLAEMTAAEWESLCDGCGKCCLLKVEYEDTGEVFPTSVSCKLLDRDTCRCSDYADRKRHVPDCIQLTAAMVDNLSWLPSTCAYRLLSEGKALAWWHPLVSGSAETVHEAGISIRQRTISEDEAGDELQDWIVDWKL
ncbi:putative cysteine cluster protein YcgN (CxxCxxCC family) [Constrictibacter sp. MBR-5]|jgi:uncharacterized cysteine cluster protein YcgN (CxxCxxCC family)|uniref:YcgN family cysteine cluster protein n=1 Tax=Constrictibacter sp. MBR-5 TaxID=3156467 RepID=UPI003396A55B